ncbi:MAG TPA: FkbM family methyltransferase [Mucilaginibacter sp.]|nr:FkbM family methyltransferase [Mucilaginibacter sp.]
MRLSLFYNPLVIIDRLAIEINRRKRKRKLKGTPAEGLGLGYIDSLELLELVRQKNTKVKVIYDVGANIGTWTMLAKSFFKDAQVHAFEPLSAHTTKFAENTKNLGDIHLHKFCLGNDDTSTIINISSFSDSSSILEATPLEFEQYQIKKVDEEEVEVKKISTLISENLLPPPDLIKLDVQGFELEVLKGAEDHLAHARYIIAEVSFKAYYKNQPLFLDIANYLSGYNFRIYAFGHSTPTGQELGQIDVLFVKQ